MRPLISSDTITALSRNYNILVLGANLRKIEKLMTSK